MLCRERPAEVPDRDRAGRPVRRVCRECHAGRLRGDLLRVLRLREDKRDGTTRD